MSIQDKKAKLRKLVLEQLRQQSQLARKKKSEIIMSRLREAPSFSSSRAFMFYVATEIEVDTLPLVKEVLQRGCCVAVPVVQRMTGSIDAVQIRNPDKDLIPGTYGIREPRLDRRHRFDVSRLGLVLVPGLAFDRAGHRLGRGEGYYDRFLKSLLPHVKRIGLAFDFQLFDSIPFAKDDETVNRVITNA
ncbi:MAG: 5-formyltetrahydrofolate cyclo-ligase [Omnitrophica bacterium RIFCSPLOWO2_12_FULL_50_11]|nr:MAG: 5-formyltetrahydrofolate cyclo-ligase [Omnitrophica bacterium RIFCSPLOWO2_12_FULL_50_11]